MSKAWSDSLQLGKYTLKNRIFMSALTRTRCNPADGIPTDLLAKYYTQRAGAGLIFTEAVAWSQRGQGFPGAACLHTPQQAQGWKKITESVHQKGGKIFAQLFHAGRNTHPSLIKGLQTWAPSAIAIRQKIKELNDADYTVPKAMTLEDIQTLKKQFEASVKLSIAAGFDGICFHSAFGYLMDQFLRSGSNQRTDQYGGNHINRSRLQLEIMDIALKHYQPYQVGTKLSPTARIKDMYDQNPVETYSYLLQQLSKKKIGFVELAESESKFNNSSESLYAKKPHEQMDDVAKILRPHFNGMIIGNYGFNPQSGLQKIQSGSVDAITFGRLYISNPDLAERIIAGQKVNQKLDFTTLYANPQKPLEKGYTDYPVFAQN